MEKRKGTEKKRRNGRKEKRKWNWKCSRSHDERDISSSNIQSIIILKTENIQNFYLKKLLKVSTKMNKNICFALTIFVLVGIYSVEGKQFV